MVWSIRMPPPRWIAMLEGTIQVVGREQLLAQRTVARALALHLRPERARVVHVAKVGELVANHVVDERFRGLHQAPREAHLAPRVAASPARERGRQHEARWVDARTRALRRHALLQVG